VFQHVATQASVRFACICAMSGKALARPPACVCVRARVWLLQPHEGAVGPGIAMFAAAYLCVTHESAMSVTSPARNISQPACMAVGSAGSAGSCSQSVFLVENSSIGQDGSKNAGFAVAQAVRQ